MVVVVLLLSAVSSAQDVDLKQEAQEAFKAANYPQAISLLKQSVARDPDDAEAYYYLGYFTHYLCYDSMPLTGYGVHNSDEVLMFLRKAVALDPKLGNAYYFIGAEYGARFLRRMQAGQLEGMVSELKKGRQEGGLPDWLVEFNRNMLKSCAPHAILFTGGDSETDAAWYLQYVENVRRDVTVMPVAALRWPWYVLTMKANAHLIPTLAPISWSKDQILSMRPYKWKSNKIIIPISEAVRREYHLEDEKQQMEWVVEANLSDERGTYLGAELAVMVDIIKTNAWKRPVYFSLGCHPAWRKGLENYLQFSGIAYRLLPAETGGSVSSLDVEKTEEILLNLENFQNVEEVATKDYSRIASMLKNYRAVFMRLIQHYQLIGDLGKAKAVLETMKKALPAHAMPMSPGLSRWIEHFERELREDQ
jgi:tetratricopeptide (TPR) repeat protein